MKGFEEVLREACETFKGARTVTRPVDWSSGGHRTSNSTSRVQRLMTRFQGGMEGRG